MKKTTVWAVFICYDGDHIKDVVSERLICVCSTQDLASAYMKLHEDELNDGESFIAVATEEL